MDDSFWHKPVPALLLHLPMRICNIWSQWIEKSFVSMKNRNHIKSKNVPKTTETDHHRCKFIVLKDVFKTAIHSSWEARQEISIINAGLRITYWPGPGKWHCAPQDTLNTQLSLRLCLVVAPMTNVPLQLTSIF